MKRQLRIFLCGLTAVAGWLSMPVQAISVMPSIPEVTSMPRVPGQNLAEKAFFKLMPSLKCTLGFRSCTPQEISRARLKVKAYIAAFGIAALFYGVRMYMSAQSANQLPIESVQTPYDQTVYEEEIYTEPIPDYTQEKKDIDARLMKAWNKRPNSQLYRGLDLADEKRNVHRQYKDILELYNYIKNWTPHPENPPSEFEFTSAF